MVSLTVKNVVRVIKIYLLRMYFMQKLWESVAMTSIM